MNKKIFAEVVKQLWYYVLAYFTHYIMPIIKETLEKTKDYFINLLWNTLRERFTEIAEPAVEFMEKYFSSMEYQQKEKDIIDTIFRNANFPILLRPFKPLLKKILQDKLHDLINSCLEKIKAKL